MKTRITEAEYLAELERTLTAKPPPGAFSIETLVERGLKRNTVYGALQAEVKAGKLESAVFVTNGKQRRFYWMPKGKKGRR